MSILKLAFQVFEQSPAPLSARDLEVRLPVTVVNPRRITAELRNRGLIEPTGAVGRAHERYYTLVPGALPPIDKRATSLLMLNAKRLITRNRVRRIQKGRTK